MIEPQPHLPNPGDAPEAAPVKNWWQQIVGQWPLAITLLGVGLGVLVATLGRWRSGSSMMGGTIILAGLFRLLPDERVGLLKVRSRWFDVSFLLLLGSAIVALAWLVPPSKG